MHVMFKNATTQHNKTQYNDLTLINTNRNNNGGNIQNFSKRRPIGPISTFRKKITLRIV